MTRLADLVRRSIAGWDARLEVALFATDDPERIAAALEECCAEAVGDPVEALLYQPGVGVVAAWRLADGREVCIKVHRWNAPPARLAAIQTVQRHVADRGVPAPRPLAEPRTCGTGVATIEEYLPGASADGRDPGVRAGLAAGLAELVEAARPLVGSVDVGSPSILRDPDAPLWPEPHSVRFDFAATSAGAEWIDELAGEARRRLAGRDCDGSDVIGHFDWRVENLGFDAGRVVAIYDWDSIGAAPEPVVVGMVAAEFCSDWSSSEVDTLPTLDDMVAFVGDYELARGRPFSAGERDVLDAANLALAAYGARCQHSDLTLHPDLGSTTDNRWLRLLRQRGAHFFDGG